MFRRLSLLLVAVLCSVQPHLSVGQTSQGTLTGVARDKTGAVVGNAKITLTNQDTGEKRSLQTKSDGSYRADAISPGKYTITASEAGFTTYEVKDVTVLATTVVSYDVVLSVGSSSEEVRVEADQATINTENGVLGGVVSAIELDKIPQFSQSPYELATTVPGVQAVPQGGFSNGINIQVNGARSRANNFLLDGQEINDVSIAGQAFQPSIPDLFGDLTVLTNSASAEYGRGSGGIVNLTTKQGTNTYHGSLFERYTGSGLNSVPGGIRGTPFTKARYDQHSYGFTGGGRIFRDKLFAYGGLEIQRYYGKEQAGTNLLPDAAGYATLQTITGSPQAQQVQTLDAALSNGAYLTADNIYYKSGAGTGTPVTSKNVGALPGCPATGCVITFAGFQRPNQSTSNPLTQWSYRVDYTPWQKDHLYFRYLHSRTSLSPDFGNNGNALAGFDTQLGGPSELGEGAWTHIFSSKLLNEFRASETRINFQFAATPATAANPLNNIPTLSFGSLSGTASNGGIAFPALGPNQNFPQGRAEDLYQFQDTVTYNLGRNTVRGGADIGRLIEIEFISQNALGQLSFTAGGSGVTSLGNFLLNQLGPSGSATKTFGKTRGDAHGWRNSGFLEDDFKVTSDLTFNIGLRYDYQTNPANISPYPAIDPNNVYAPINTFVPVKQNTANFGPRAGFAYNPHYRGLGGDGKTVIRGGFGIFYDSIFSNILVNNLQSSPNAVSGLLTQTTGNGLANASTLIAQIGPQLSAQSAVTSEVNNLLTPRTYEFNLGIERELPGQNTLDVRYVGTIGQRLYANQQYNYFSGLTGTRLNTTRGAINARGNFAVSNYNALEVSVKHNYRKGFVISANYTLSHDLDDGSEVFSLGSPTSYDANLAVGGRRLDYGNSGYDHRQNLSISYAWTPKGFRSASNGFLDEVLDITTRHFSFAGVTQLQSGNFDTVNVSGLDLNGDGSTANDRPITLNPTASFQNAAIDGHFLGAGATSGTYYDMASFNGGTLVVADLTKVHYLIPYFPNNSYLNQETARNTLLQPGHTTHNMSLEKGIGLQALHLERGSFIVRAEAQNVFNHNDKSIGDTNALDAGAGFYTPTRIGSNRTVILWGKILF